VERRLVGRLLARAPLVLLRFRVGDGTWWVRVVGLARCWVLRERALLVWGACVSSAGRFLGRTAGWLRAGPASTLMGWRRFLSVGGG
jgi:hypothetical protein